MPKTQYLSVEKDEAFEHRVVSRDLREHLTQIVQITADQGMFIFCAESGNAKSPREPFTREGQGRILAGVLDENGTPAWTKDSS